MTINRAEIIERKAFLFSSFGEEMARRYFGAELVESMPRYVKGKNKGKLKGYIVWHKVERGGWHHNFGQGYAERRVGKVVLVELCNSEWGADTETVYAKWDWHRLDMNDREKAKLWDFRDGPQVRKCFG